MRTFVARGSQGAGDTVVGITVVESNTERGFSEEGPQLELKRHIPWQEDEKFGS